MRSFFINFISLFLLLFNVEVLSSSIYDVEESLFESDILSMYGSHSHNRAKEIFVKLKLFKNKRDISKVKSVNDIINQNIKYLSDEVNWNTNDYWSTPFELIGNGYGDCEDYAIAKFFLLLKMGIPKEKLKIVYARQLEVDKPHMVLAYHESENNIYILDNYDKRLLKINQRKDLIPIYSFNSKSIWITNINKKDKKVVNHSGLSKFEDLIVRIKNQKNSVYKNIKYEFK